MDANDKETGGRLKPLTSLPYEEPSMVTILILASFLVFVNVAREIASGILGAGLLGELFTGLVYSAPLASILPDAVQYTVQSFGYLGLVLLITEGGMDTRMDLLGEPKTLLTSFFAGCTGVGMPIALSFALLCPAFGFSKLEAFATGSALSSTSLGTTFSVLGNFNVNGSRENIMDTTIGTILVGVAVLDDIVGLVLSKIIENLSPSHPITAWTIARPVVVSIVYVCVSAGIYKFAVVPMVKRWSHMIVRALMHISYWPLVRKDPRCAGVVAFIAFLSGCTSIANYIGTSNLVGAFTAGASMKLTFDVLLKNTKDPELRKSISLYSPGVSYGYIKCVVTYVLVPFFFASVGAAIPIKEMFVGRIVWKGVLFSLLMIFAKISAGLWVFPLASLKLWQDSEKKSGGGVEVQEESSDGVINLTNINEGSQEPEVRQNGPQVREASVWDIPVWPCGLFLGMALVARGEIGYLIINIARRADLIDQDAFLVGIWAITLNTLVGPTSVGSIMKISLVKKAVFRGCFGTQKGRNG